MVQLWVIIGLALSAISVSVLGATFSILGMGKLFSGAILAVWLMSGALELAKFTVAAYLHQTWHNMRLAFKIYLISSVAILSLITSMGIFGFLSDAYNSSSALLESENIRLQKLQNEQAQINVEIARINRAIDEIPADRITKKMKARTEAEPALKELFVKNTQVEAQMTEAKLKIVTVKQKVGPLIYISKAFNIDIDTVVKYLILVLVSVFDPLAICLVIAFSDSILKRKNRSAINSFAQQSSVQQNETEGVTLKMTYDTEEPSTASRAAPHSPEGDVG